MKEEKRKSVAGREDSILSSSSRWNTVSSSFASNAAVLSTKCFHLAYLSCRSPKIIGDNESSRERIGERKNKEERKMGHREDS